jgi:hypothetical protein
VLLLEIFVGKLFAVDRPAARALFHAAAVSKAPKRRLGSGEARAVAASHYRSRRLNTTYIATSKVAPLNHERRDNAMEFGAGVAIALLARAQCAEVLRRLGHDVVVEIEADTALLLCRQRPC